jgi:biopolymer transport protein TolQ
MKVDVWAILADTGPFARVILFVLLGFSVGSWAIMIDRWRFFRQLRAESARFLDSARRAHRSADLFALGGRERHSALGRLTLAGQRKLSARTVPEKPLGPDDLAGIRRTLDAAMIEETGRLEARLGFLATTGSLTPFVGLLGTVWGVMTAFFDMGRQGQANLAVVAPGIAEALIATAAGLGAAIPAVIGYNFFVGKVRAASASFEVFSLEFLNLIDREYGP